ncbi:MAG: hypothetical protein CMJ18_26635 [Phycisphaeraceae bacterium]|nr:hypothetical protein [Phycisphaeraceae bacterium]
MRWVMIASIGTMLLVAVTVAESRKPTAGRATPDTPARAVPAAKSDGKFDANAFPPTLPDTEWHQDAWIRHDCMRCHETGVGEAPTVVHRGMPPILLVAKCRTCHVIAPGSKPRGAKRAAQPNKGLFNANAFPPMIPASGSHRRTWRRDDCLLCHEDGLRGAPIVRHKGMPGILLKSKCRSCHVQVRSIEADVPEP